MGVTLYKKKVNFEKIGIEITKFLVYFSDDFVLSVSVSVLQRF